MAFGTRPHHTRHQRLAPQSLARRLRAWREGKNLSQSEAALKLQISKRTLQEWEQDRSAPRGFARTAIEKNDSSLAARILSVLLCYTGFTYSGYFPK
jgi:DNA-binding transcriptional regulator YiaG